MVVVDARELALRRALTFCKENDLDDPEDVVRVAELFHNFLTK